MAGVQTSSSLTLADGLVIVFFLLVIWLIIFLERSGAKRRSAVAKGEDVAADTVPAIQSWPPSDGQLQQLFDTILAAAITQKADTILIEPMTGRGKVRLRVDGCWQELTGLSDPGTYERLVALARSHAGLAETAAPAFPEQGHFKRMNRDPQLRNERWRVADDSFAFWEEARCGRIVHFDLDAFPSPGGQALSIAVHRQQPSETSRFDLGFEPGAEQLFIRAVSAASGLLLFSGPCHAGKSTATYAALRLLRGLGKRIATVEWPVHQELRGVQQFEFFDQGDTTSFFANAYKNLDQALASNPDVLLVQNIDWIDDEFARKAIRFAGPGRLLITAVHRHDVAQALWFLLSYSSQLIGDEWVRWKRFPEAEEVFRMVVAPRTLPLICAHCAEELRLPAYALAKSGLADPPREALAADGRVITWRGRGCGYCQGSGTHGLTGIYEVLDVTPELKRQIAEAARAYPDFDQLRLQLWRQGLSSKRELALRRVLAGDVSLEKAILETPLPSWLLRAQQQSAARIKQESGAVV
jgi:type IV pilus assembly protein PilB